MPTAPCAQRGSKENRLPARICLQARGSVVGILLTLWFQRYFRKKRSLQRNILKKYEPVTHYLSIYILIFSVEGKSNDSTAILTHSNHESLLSHLCSHNVWFNQLTVWIHFHLVCMRVSHDWLLVLWLFSSVMGRVTEWAASERLEAIVTHNEIKELQDWPFSDKKNTQIVWVLEFYLFVML